MNQITMSQVSNINKEKMVTYEEWKDIENKLYVYIIMICPNK